MRQILVTPAAGKRLIARAMVKHPDIRRTLDSGTIVIIAGTTNGYVAEEILKHLEQAEGFDRGSFYRGVVLPPGSGASTSAQFPGDVVITRGEWRRGLTVFDVVEELVEDDVILKGANALDLIRREAAVYVGHSKSGTIGAAIPAVVGRRVRLLIPVGLEKRIYDDISTLAAWVNSPGVQGPRLMPMPGEVFTELDAVPLLTGVSAEMIAAGGVSGAEGAVWLGLNGSAMELEKAQETLRPLLEEPPFCI